MTVRQDPAVLQELGGLRLEDVRIDIVKMGSESSVTATHLPTGLAAVAFGDHELLCRRLALHRLEAMVLSTKGC